MIHKIKKGSTRYKALDAKQTGLKLLANVTYGYVAAGFSGRMPCAEIADAIVQTGRDHLQKAMDMVNNNSDWGGSVVYGDTDSMFVHLPGKSREQAFAIGKAIAETVTNSLPKPMCLNFEKVYLKCFLVEKKRYVGFKGFFVLVCVLFLLCLISAALVTSLID